MSGNGRFSLAAGIGQTSGWEGYAVTLKPSDIRIERVLDEHLATIRTDLDEAVAQCNAVPRA